MRSGCTVLVAGLLCGPVMARADGRTDAYFHELADHVRAADSIDAKAKEMILTRLSQRDENSDEQLMVIEALVLMSDDFLEAMDAFDDEDYAKSLELLAPLRESDDPFIRQNAAACEVRCLVQIDKLLEARERIEAIKADMENFARYCLDAGEMEYLLGYCQIQSMQYGEGQATLESFLDRYPDAPQRFIVTARQMLAEVARVLPDGIGEIGDLMNFSRRRLAQADDSERVHEAQDRIVALLDKLIEKAEQMEQSQQQQQQQQRSQQQRNQQQQQNQDSKQSNQPMQDSKLVDGKPADADKRPGRRVNPGEAWGSMPDAQRERVLQVLRDSFPGRYRALVEQYYESLAEEP